MADQVKVDKRGRITIPSHIRNVLGIDEDTTIEITIQANLILFLRVSCFNQKRAEEWFYNMIHTSIPAFTEPFEPDHDPSKYYSEEYIKRNLGL